jgi:hypothetical protein
LRARVIHDVAGIRTDSEGAVPIAPLAPRDRDRLSDNFIGDYGGIWARNAFGVEFRNALQLGHTGLRSAVGAGAVARLLIRPSRERLLERAFAGRALLDCQNRAPAVVVHERNIEPGLLFEHLQVTLHFGIGRREADEEQT